MHWTTYPATHLLPLPPPSPTRFGPHVREHQSDGRLHVFHARLGALKLGAGVMKRV